MCGYPNKDVYKMENAEEWFDQIRHEIRDGNIGEPVKHFESEPLDAPIEAPAPVEAPAAPAPTQEPVPA